MEEKLTGKRYKELTSFSRAERMAYETERAAQRARRVLHKKDYEKYDLDDLKKRYRSIDESLSLPESKLKSVVKSVDKVSS